MTLTVGVSEGTAGVLGLIRRRLRWPPTTAYLMVGTDCFRNCAFCGQSRRSSGASDRLSRVHWPQFSLEDVRKPLQEKVLEGALIRACLQVVGGHEDLALEVALALNKDDIPTNVSFHIGAASRVPEFLEAGVDKVSLPLDAASEKVFSRIKGGSFRGALSELMELGRRYPDRVATHLMAGLGESERHLVQTALDLHGARVGLGLFAFTPLPGTPLAGHSQPDPASYRRLQAALFLIRRDLVPERALFSFDNRGRLSGIALDPDLVRGLLESGKAFETSGCQGCNRPYYNESARGFIYNYPRPLSVEEARQEADLALCGIKLGSDGRREIQIR